jgi:hypothetical protein
MPGHHLDVSLITRTFHERREAVLLAVECIIIASLPGRRAEAVYVLDDTQADRAFGDELLHKVGEVSSGSNTSVDGQVRVVYEPLPPCDAIMFPGKLDRRQGGSPGKDRSQWSNFIMDRYARAPMCAK